MKRTKILIAESEPRRARLYQTSLEADGFQIVPATDSVEAWHALQTQDLALAIVDTHLPGLTEHNLLLDVRANPNLAKLLILILGDSAFSEEAVVWLDWGADAYLSRSISPELLRASVRAKLRRSKPFSENVSSSGVSTKLR